VQKKKKRISSSRKDWKGMKKIVDENEKKEK